MDAREQVEGGELLVGAVVGPDGFEAEFVAVLEPERDLFDDSGFEVCGERVAPGVSGESGRRKPPV